MSCSVEDTKAVAAQVALYRFAVALRRQVWTGQKKSVGAAAVLRAPVISEKEAGAGLMNLCPQGRPRDRHSRCFVNTDSEIRETKAGPNFRSVRVISIQSTHICGAAYSASLPIGPVPV